MNPCSSVVRPESAKQRQAAAHRRPARIRTWPEEPIATPISDGCRSEAILRRSFPGARRPELALVDPDLTLGGSC